MRPKEQQGPAGHLWPIHPKPFDDELLSSWMVRIARAYRVRSTSFWIHEAGRIDFRKVDLTAEPRLLQLIGARTGTPLGAGNSRDSVLLSGLRRGLARRERGCDSILSSLSRGAPLFPAALAAGIFHCVRRARILSQRSLPALPRLGSHGTGSARCRIGRSLP